MVRRRRIIGSSAAVSANQTGDPVNSSIFTGTTSSYRFSSTWYRLIIPRARSRYQIDLLSCDQKGHDTYPPGSADSFHVPSDTSYSLGRLDGDFQANAATIDPSGDQRGE